MCRYRLVLLVALAIFVPSIVMATLGTIPAVVLAQTDAYQITLLGWGSGGRIAGGAYQMDVTISQPEADEVGGGNYTLNGGIGGGRRVVIAQASPTATPISPGAGERVYLPLIER